MSALRTWLPPVTALTKRLPARPSVLSNYLENPSANRAELASQMHGGIAVACSANISEADFQRIELWLAKKRTGTGYECGEEYEPLTPVDDSAVCALILDGSFRSRSVLDDMLGLEKACVTDRTDHHLRSPGEGTIAHCGCETGRTQSEG